MKMYGLNSASSTWLDIRCICLATMPLISKRYPSFRTNAPVGIRRTFLSDRKSCGKLYRLTEAIVANSSLHLAVRQQHQQHWKTGRVTTTMTVSLWWTEQWDCGQSCIGCQITAVSMKMRRLTNKPITDWKHHHDPSTISCIVSNKSIQAPPVQHTHTYIYIYIVSGSLYRTQWN